MNDIECMTFFLGVDYALAAFRIIKIIRSRNCDENSDEGSIILEGTDKRMVPEQAQP